VGLTSDTLLGEPEGLQRAGPARGVTTRSESAGSLTLASGPRRENPAAEAASHQGRGYGGRSCESVDPNLRLPGDA